MTLSNNIAKKQLRDNNFLKFSTQGQKKEGVKDDGNSIWGGQKAGATKSTTATNPFDKSNSSDVKQEQAFGQAQEKNCNDYFGNNGEFDQGTFYDDTLGLNFGNSSAKKAGGSNNLQDEIDKLYGDRQNLLKDAQCCKYDISKIDSEIAIANCNPENQLQMAQLQATKSALQERYAEIGENILHADNQTKILYDKLEQSNNQPSNADNQKATFKYEQFDFDKNGKLDYAENQARQAYESAKFKMKFDINGDGELDKAETAAYDAYNKAQDDMSADEIQKEISNIDQKINETSSNYENLKSQVDNLESKKTEAEDKVDQYYDEIKTNKDKANDCQNKIEGKTSELNNAQNDLSNAQGMPDEIQAGTDADGNPIMQHNTEKDVAIAKAEEKIEKLKSEIEELKQEKAEFENKADEAEENKQGAEKQLKEINNKLEETQDAQDKCKEKLDELKVNQADAKNKLNVAKAKETKNNKK